MKEHVLISIRPPYANLILSGHKKIELRRKIPANLKTGSVVVVYSTSPQKEIIGAFTVKGIIKADINKLWNKTKRYSYINFENFMNYFSGMEYGYGIEVDETWRFKEPINLDYIKKKSDNFVVPQSYRYLSYTDSLLIDKDFSKKLSFQFAF